MNIGAFITVRLGSSRLPRKAMMEISGKPIIQYLVDRIKTVQGISKIVICTTDRDEDRLLVELANKNNIYCFCGDEKDIIKRQYMAAVEFGLDFIVNVDGDDIFCDPLYIQKVIDLYYETDADIIRTEGLPFGANSFGYKFKVIEKIFSEKKEEDTQTGWGEYFKKQGNFDIKVIKAENKLHRPEVRMTLDYEEDFIFFKTVIEELYPKNNMFQMSDIIRLLDEKPEIKEINKSVEDKYWANYNQKKAIQ